MTTSAPTHSCYTVREGKEGAKGFWVEIGAAWVNRDESLTLRLDALPVNGQIIVQKRDSKPDSSR